MGIPIIDEIWAGLRWIIDQFTTKIPRPMQFLLFLLFIVVLGALLPYFLHLMGVHCNSQNQPVTTDVWNIPNNIAIWSASNQIISGTNLTLCQINPEKCGYEDDCYIYAKETGTKLIHYEKCFNDTANCYYLYRGGDRCYNCTTKTLCESTAGIFGVFTGECRPYCVGDVRPKPAMDVFCTNAGYGECQIPPGYVFNYTTERYFQEFNVTYSTLDIRLNRGNAQLLYGDTPDGDFKRFIGITCDKNFNPQISLYSIQIFRYEFWILLMVIYVMFIFLSHIRKH